MNMYAFALLDLIELDYRPVILVQSHFQLFVAQLQYVLWLQPRTCKAFRYFLFLCDSALGL